MKLELTPENSATTAVTVLLPGAIWPLGGFPGAGLTGSSKGTLARVKTRAPFTTGQSVGSFEQSTEPITWLPTWNVTLFAGSGPLTLAGETVAMKVTRSLYCLGLGVTVTVAMVTTGLIVSVPFTNVIL